MQIKTYTLFPSRKSESGTFPLSRFPVRKLMQAAPNISMLHQYKIKKIKISYFAATHLFEKQLKKLHAYTNFRRSVTPAVDESSPANLLKLRSLSQSHNNQLISILTQISLTRYIENCLAFNIISIF